MQYNKKYGSSNLQFLNVDKLNTNLRTLNRSILTYLQIKNKVI